jgi:hypothetical protein
MTQALLFAPRQPSAVFSDDLKYRWTLEWPTGLANERALLFIGANPSKAGSLDTRGIIRSDPTISRMRGLARELGYGLLWAVNARSWIATDPKQVPGDPEAIGEETDYWIGKLSGAAALVVVAYGHLAGVRGPRVLELVRQAGKVPHALALTGDGVPRHPRGIPKSARPFPLLEIK